MTPSYVLTLRIHLHINVLSLFQQLSARYSLYTNAQNGQLSNIFTYIQIH